jgi:flagellar assembly factor FliW
MPSIRTRFFGVVECAPEDVISFPAGIPPFAGSTQFVLMSDERKRPLLFLQSVDEEHLCFITIPIRVLDTDYQFAVEPHDLQAVQWHEERQPSFDDLVCLGILTVPETGSVTANLLAPVLINSAAQLGVQAVRADNLYMHAHALDQPIHAGGAAC